MRASLGAGVLRTDESAGAGVLRTDESTGSTDLFAGDVWNVQKWAPEEVVLII